MSKLLRHCSLSVLALLLGAAATLAQGTTGSSIRGKVISDADGSPLPGVTATAVHQPTGTRSTAITQADGGFALLNVRAGGPYTIEASLDGFKAQSLTDQHVRLGETLDLQFRLQPETVVEETITVTSSSPLINSSRTGSTSQVSEEQIETLPTITRGLEDFARTNPFFTVAQINEDPQSISVLGRSGRYNNIQIDGAVNNDLFGLAAQGTPGGQADTQPISLDAIQELQLLVTPFDVRQGGFSGGGVNAVTRSGTNSLQGSVFLYTRDDGYVGDGPDQLGEFGEFEEDQYGFRLGGPIRRDRMFFFVNGEISDRSRPSGVSIDGVAGQAFAGGTRVAEAELFRQTLIDRYGFDPGSLSQQTIDTPSDKFFARFDFNLNDSHTLTLRHNYVDAENDVNRPSTTTYEWPSETYLFQNETNSTVAQLNSVFGANMFNEARLVNQRIKDRRAGVGSPFPWIEIENIQPDDGLEFEVGTEAFSTHNSLDQDILEITNDFTWLRGDHTFVFGTHNELFSFDNLFIQNGFGSYEFDTLQDFLDDNPARRFQYTIVNDGRSPSQKFDVEQYGFYAGDEWRVRPNLTLQYGLRVDIPYFPDDPSRNPDTEERYGFRTDQLPDGNELWSPRFGFNWDIQGDGRQQLRGGAGIFSGRTPYVWISNNYAATGIEQTRFTAFDVPFEPDPFNQPVVGTGATGEFNLIDPDFEFPQALRYNLGYDRELPWRGIVGSVEMVISESLEEIDYRDLNLVQTGTTPFDGRPVYGARVDPSVSGAYLITNTGEGETTNLSVKLEQPLRNRFSWFVAYANGDSESVNDGTSSRAVSNYQFNEAVDPNRAEVATSEFEVEHRFTASASYRADWGGSDWGTTFGLFFNHQSGRPYSFIYGNQVFPSVNADAYFSNDLIYVPASEADVVLQNGTWQQLDAFIRSEPCLDSNRGNIAPRNCAVAPWSHTLDLQVLQDIPLWGRHRLQVSVNVENLGNLLDEDAGVVEYVPFSTLAPVGFRGTTADGRPIYSLSSIVTDPDNVAKYTTHNILSRWRAKLGLRWSF